MLSGKIFSIPFCYIVLMFVLMFNMKENFVLLLFGILKPLKNFSWMFLISLYSMTCQNRSSTGKVNGCLIEHYHERELSFTCSIKTKFMALLYSYYLSMISSSKSQPQLKVGINIQKSYLLPHINFHVMVLREALELKVYWLKFIVFISNCSTGDFKTTILMYMATYI